MVNELRKQYEVVEVNAEFPIPEDIDALLVALPSSMQTDQMANVAEYIRRGRPAMILVDPFPAVNPTLAPTEWVGEGNPFTYPPGSARPGPRGNVRQWIRDLGVDWEPTRILWDSYNPHPDLSYMPSEVVFLGPGNENPETFNPDVDVVRDLQELVLLYPGFLRQASGPDVDPEIEFEPLLRTGVVSGHTGYFSIVRQSFFGPSINPNPVREQDDEDFVVAARVRRAGPAASAPEAAEAPEAEAPEAEAPASEEAGEGDETAAEEESETAPAAEEAADTEAAGSADTEAGAVSAAEASAESESSNESEASAESDDADESAEPGELDTEDAAAAADESGSDWTTEGPLNLVVVADLDFISEQFFQIREVAPGNLNFDNVTFFLNAMDSLLEDDSFIGLRSRRARHRTLEQVEAQTAEFVEQRTLDEQQAEEEAEQALTDAQSRLNDRVAEVQNRTDIDAQAKQIMARNLEEVENRRLAVLSTNIEAEKQTKIRASLERMETQIRRIQSTIKTFAILLPPVPVFALGVAIFVRRQRREREGAAAARRLRD